MISLCYASGELVCPGTATEARLDGSEEFNALANRFTFFGFSINSYFLFLLLSFLSFLFNLLKTQPPALKSSSVMDSVYNIDVDRCRTQFNLNYSMGFNYVPLTLHLA